MWDKGTNPRCGAGLVEVVEDGVKGRARTGLVYCTVYSTCRKEGQQKKTRIIRYASTFQLPALSPHVISVSR